MYLVDRLIVHSGESKSILRICVSIDFKLKTINNLLILTINCHQIN